MIRTWDNWNRYLDLNSKPLHGCVQFMVKDGNTKAPIYDTDGTPLANPIITDVYGRTEHQVCVDVDVIAYFYKYIGNGIWSSEDDIDTSDWTKWALQYTSESALSLNMTIEARSTFAVMNIEELRRLKASDVSSIDGVKIVTLMGYNEAGDKEPINYLWDSESTEADDGGAVIATNLIKGRWVMVCPTEHLDVRHYGVFPSNTLNMTDQTLAVQRALVYANNHGLRLFFDTLTDTQTYRYYKLSNITLNPVNVIDLANGVIFIDDDLTIHSQQSRAFSNDPFFKNGDTVLYSNFAKSSWNIKTLSKAKTSEDGKYIIDDNSLSEAVNTLQDWDVDVEQNISRYSFTQCNVYGPGQIHDSSFTTCRLNMKGTIGNSCDFTNCILNEYIFNGSPSVGEISNSIFDIDDFAHKLNLWNALYVKQGDCPDIDFKNLKIPTDFSITAQYDDDRTYSNFIGTAPTASGHIFGDGETARTYTFKNFFGNIILEGNGDHKYVFENSRAKVNFENTDGEYEIVLRDSEVVVGDDLPNANITANSSTITIKSEYNIVVLHNSTLNGDVSNRRLVCSNFQAYSSAVNEEVSAPVLLYKDTMIHRDIFSTNDGTSINAHIDNCIWNNVQHHLESDTPDTVINAIWTNNYATKATPIDIDMTNILNNDGLHSYKYENNTGTFLQKSVHLSYQLFGCFTIPQGEWNALIASRPELFTVPHLITGPYAWPIQDDSNKATWSYGVYIPENWQPDCQFFSIGQATRRIKLTIKVPFNQAKLLDNFNWYNENTGWDATPTYTYCDDVIGTGMNGPTHKLTEFADKLLVGPQVIPYSYSKPAAVPAESIVVPPVGASNSHFNVEIEIF